MMVTHSVQAASYSNRVLFIRDGIVYHELYRGNLSVDDFRDKIAQSMLVVTNRGEQHEE